VTRDRKATCSKSSRSWSSSQMPPNPFAGRNAYNTLAALGPTVAGRRSVYMRRLGGAYAVSRYVGSDGSASGTTGPAPSQLQLD
jgi:hypothetical protein